MVWARRLGAERRRWLGLAALVLAAGALIPAALAVACNPQAYLTIDKSQYAPGESVRVAGSFFKANANITVSVDRTGQSTTVTTTANGAFQATFALPSGAASGGYSVQAIGYETNGDVTPGLPARGSFSVAEKAAPQPSAGGSGQSASPASEPAAQAGQPAASQAPQSAATPAQRPATGQPSKGYREPSVITEPEVQSSRESRSAASRGPSTARSDRAASRGATRSDAATANGRRVFGGSVAPGSSPSAGSSSAVVPATAAVTGRSTSPRTARSGAAVGTRGARVAAPQGVEQTATDDVWSAASSERSPSVMPVAGDGAAVGSSSAGSNLALGLLLLGAGVALVGGLAAVTARRRIRLR